MHPRLAAAVLALCRDPHLSSEVADEAFSRALERWPRVSEMSSPEAWVYRTAVNHLRRRAHRSQLERRLLRRTPLHSADEYRGRDLDLLAAIAELPDRQRLAVVLHYVADLSINDTAEVMAVKPGTVLATVHAARANLLKSLGPTEQEAAP